VAPRRRRHRDATPRDALLLGLAQACALVPGVSRSAATLAAARARGFRGADAARLSREAAVPVLVAATALKAVRARPTPAGAAGAAASFAATLAARPLARALAGPLAPWAAYRALLAGAILRVRQTRAS